jgi:hypothetical protein
MGKLCRTVLYRFVRENCVELDCIYLGGGKLCGTGLYRFGGFKMCGTVLRRFWGGANCVELYCIDLGGQIVWNCTV